MTLALNTVHIGDARDLATQLAPQSIQCIVTSPPYFGLRSYLPADHPNKVREMGSEDSPEEFVAHLVELFAALRPALRDDGTIFLNLGDSYNAYNGNAGQGGPVGLTQSVQRPQLPPGHGLTVKTLKPKDLIGIPWRVAFALQADGWTLRSDIIWHKPNPMPESVRDRPTRSHEYLFLLTKKAAYYYDADAIREPQETAERSKFLTGDEKKGRYPARFGLQGTQGALREKRPERLLDPRGRNKRDVWTIPTEAYPEAHFATFPSELIRPCIRAGCPVGGVVSDPFAGSGTVAEVCVEEGRNWIGFDLDDRSVGWHEGRLRALPVRSLFAAGVDAARAAEGGAMTPPTTAAPPGCAAGRAAGRD